MKGTLRTNTESNIYNLITSFLQEEGVPVYLINKRGNYAFQPPFITIISKTQGLIYSELPPILQTFTAFRLWDDSKLSQSRQ